MLISLFSLQKGHIYKEWPRLIQIRLAGTPGDKCYQSWLEWLVLVPFLSLGLTQYRYTMANLHRMQCGRGAPVPSQRTPRIKIDLQQLDHFLGFITSPHLVQDLPFGEKNLELSSGEIKAVPNVIRTMIPERIATQYIQFCTETNFKALSRSTLLRILRECSASVRKSLQ